MIIFYPFNCSLHMNTYLLVSTSSSSDNCSFARKNGGIFKATHFEASKFCTSKPLISYNHITRFKKIDKAPLVNFLSDI